MCVSTSDFPSIVRFHVDDAADNDGDGGGGDDDNDNDDDNDDGADYAGSATWGLDRVKLPAFGTSFL